jgi:hypothetical protein
VRLPLDDDVLFDAPPVDAPPLDAPPVAIELAVDPGSVCPGVVDPLQATASAARHAIPQTCSFADISASFLREIRSAIGGSTPSFSAAGTASILRGIARDSGSP